MSFVPVCSATDTTSMFNIDSIRYSPNKFAIGFSAAWLDPMPQLSFNWKRNKIGIGFQLGKPSIYEIITINDYAYSKGSRSSFGLKGIRAFYRIHPWKPREKFNLHIECSIEYFNIKNVVNGSEFQRIHLFSNLVGFGHTQKFFKRFEFFQTIYVGAIAAKAKNQYIQYGVTAQNQFKIYSSLNFAVAYIIGVEIFLP